MAGLVTKEVKWEMSCAPKPSECDSGKVKAIGQFFPGICNSHPPRRHNGQSIATPQLQTTYGNIGQIMQTRRWSAADQTGQKMNSRADAGPVILLLISTKIE